MPNPGQANNATGINNYDPFTAEPPYGEIIHVARLAGAAPLAGGKLSAGAIGAPQRAGKKAKTKPKPPPPGDAYVHPPVALPPNEGPAPLPPGIGLLPPTSGVLGPVTGQPPWTGAYPPGSIANSIWQQILATPGSERYPIFKLVAGRR